MSAILLLSTILSVIFAYLSKVPYMTLYQLFGTYPGDIWNMYNTYCHFVHYSLFFPMEYPIGIFLLLKTLGFLTARFFPLDIQDKYHFPIYNYENYLKVNFVLILIFSLLVVFILYKINQKLNGRKEKFFQKRILLFFIFSPSFILYSFANYDILPVLLMMAALFFFLKKKEFLSGIFLGLGTVVKFFPAFALPLFFWFRRKNWWHLVSGFLSAWLLFNLPFAFYNFKTWSSPYLWQSNSPMIKVPNNFHYPIMKVFGITGAKLAFPLIYLLIFFLIIKKQKESPQLKKLVGFLLLLFIPFLLFGIVFGPQYFIWLLPFLVFYPEISYLAWLPLDLLNSTEIFFLFKLKKIPLLLSSLYMLRALGLLSILIYLLYQLKIIKLEFFLKLFEKIKKIFSRKKARVVLITLLLFSFFIRILNLSRPPQHIFDEVYYAFTANAYLRGEKQAYIWWSQAPKGFSYDLMHPPLAKLIMAGGIFLFGNNSFGWRISSAIFGTLACFALYLLTKAIFKKEKIALYSLLLFSLDGLVFVQSRIGMLDIFLTTFLLFSFYFLIKFLKEASNPNLLLTTVFLGLAFACKWTAVFLGILISLLILKKSASLGKKNVLRICCFFILIPGLIYLLSYSQFFLLGFNFEDFLKNHQEAIKQHLNLDTSHDYASFWWSWPLLLRPVWYYVNYQNDSIANIYALGNPLIWWPAIFSFLLFLISQLKKKISLISLSVILAFFIQWLPYAFKPSRVAFLFYFLPALPFLIIPLAWLLDYLENKKEQSLVFLYLALIGLSFLFFYPHLTGLPIPKSLDHFYYWLPSWK